MANQLEKKIKTLFERKGWTVLTSGWPDMLCVKNNKIKAVEVKAKTDKIRPNQEKMLTTLAKFIPVRTAHDGPGFGDELQTGEAHILIYPYNSLSPFPKTRVRGRRSVEFDGLGVS